MGEWGEMGETWALGPLILETVGYCYYGFLDLESEVTPEWQILGLVARYNKGCVLMTTKRAANAKTEVEKAKHGELDGVVLGLFSSFNRAL